MEVVLLPQLNNLGASAFGAPVRYHLAAKEVVDGAVKLDDRAINRIDLTTAAPVRLVFPPQEPGYARDFFVRIVITAEEVPEITFAAPAGETISFEDADEDVLTCEIGSNVFAFTETDSGIFMVNRKQIDIDVEVEFDPSGGLLDKTKESFKLGATYSALPTPVLAGMMFQGWYTAADGGVKVSASDRCKTTVTKLYAQWAVYVDPFVAAICPAGNLTFHTSGDAEWIVDDSEYVTAPASARSGGIGDDQSTSLTATVAGRGTLSFKWKTSSESGFDKLQLYVDGSCVVEDFSGDREWESVTHRVESVGTHNIEWRYSKDGSVSEGQDCGWVDDVVWTPEGGV